jgi:hypothetical protein
MEINGMLSAVTGFNRARLFSGIFGGGVKNGN